MMNIFSIFFIITLILLLYCIRKNEKSPGIKIFKPVSTFLLILISILSVTSTSSVNKFSNLITIGLLFSLFGDIFLISLEKKWFIRGLIAFLCAHVFYILALFAYGKFGSYSIIIFLFSGLILMICLPRMKLLPSSLKLPVFIYSFVITLMLERAFATLQYKPAYMNQINGQVLICLGAFLFYLSDLILALDRFMRPIPHGRFINLLLYYSGQYLIAISTWFWA